MHEKGIHHPEARNNLSRLIHEAEEGLSVALTRRGRPVAVVLSLDEYNRLQHPKTSFMERVDAFRARHDMERLAIDPDELLDGTKDRSEAPDFSW